MDNKTYTKQHYEIQQYLEPSPYWKEGWDSICRYSNLQSENEAKKWLKKIKKQYETDKSNRKLRIVFIVEEYTVNRNETILV